LSKAGSALQELSFPNHTVNTSNYAYVMEWHEYYAPKALQHILNKGLRAKVGMKQFTLNGVNYDYGTILIPVQNQKLNAQELASFLSEVSKDSHIKITGVGTGSNQFRALEPARVALIVGEGINPYDAGEIWHLFDTRYDIKITKLDTQNFGRADLSRYTDIILPNSWGQSLDSDDAEKLKTWVRSGGTLIGYKNAARFFNKEKIMNVKFKTVKDTATNISFEQRRDYYGAKVVGGAIFEAKQDRSHPVNFGYKNNTIPLFKNSTMFIEADEQSFNNPLQYTKNPLLSGYINEDNLKTMAETVAFKHNSLGRGNVILFTDNTNFRAFWYGTNKLLMNAIFFGDTM